MPSCPCGSNKKVHAINVKQKKKNNCCGGNPVTKDNIGFDDTNKNVKDTKESNEKDEQQWNTEFN